MAADGAIEAGRKNPGLMAGVNTYDGHITYAAVAESQNRPYRPIEELI